MHRVWLGAAGTGTAFGILEAIRERWGRAVFVIAADTNPRHLVAASALADEFVQLPPVAAADFGASLREGLTAHEANTYVPILDEEIILAAKLRETSSLPACVKAAACPSSAAAAVCFDKLAMSKWLVSHDLPTPKTVPIGSASFEPSGMFVKMQYGRGSIGARRILNEAELAVAQSSHDPLIAQALCSPPEVTVDVFHARDGLSFRAICRERIETKAGVCTKARVFESVELTSIARRLATDLPLHGVFCFQVMKDASGTQWMVTDVNPRPGAGTRMSAAAGIDLQAALLADLWGEPTDFVLKSLSADRFVVRQYANYAVG